MDCREHSAFRSARQEADHYARDRRRAGQLLRQFFQKAAAEEGRLRQSWEDLMTLYRMLKAWQKGFYRALPWRTIIWCLTAVIYFINPMDLVPDFIPGLGYLDDVTVIGFVMNSIRKDVDRFKFWETESGRGN
jgi:uncharacterized membrane protein YkvA (DUF1232 family)